MKPLHINPHYYDSIIIGLDITVRTSQFAYKKDNITGKLLDASQTKRLIEFEELMKDNLSFWGEDFNKQNWPLKGNLFVNIAIGLFKRDFNKKDVDNMAKPILDNMEKIVYVKDVQIRSLVIQKYITERPLYIIGIKELKDSSPLTYIPKLFKYTPYRELHYAIA
jgi:hypothetical protein